MSTLQTLVPDPSPGAASGLAAWVARHRRHLLLRKLAGACRRYLAWHGNASYDWTTNGEAFVLDTVARFGPRVIVDAGANIGEWSLAAAARCPDAIIHAFEIAPPTFATLAARMAGKPAIVCRNIGLGDHAGTVKLRHYADLPALTTASGYPHPYPSGEIEAPVMRGDDYAAKEGIERIDFLKMDVEGMEPAVLEGFSALFARDAIDVVQFEYGQVNVLNHFLLRDFHEWFCARGFVVGKIYPGYVDFRPYAFADEDFVGPNFLACRRSRSSLLQALAGSAG